MAQFIETNAIAALMLEGTRYRTGSFRYMDKETQTSQAVKMISAAHRFALTGTPVENRLEEQWSIYDAVFPELFAGRKAFTDLPPEQVARKIRP